MMLARATARERHVCAVLPPVRPIVIPRVQPLRENRHEQGQHPEECSRSPQETVEHVRRDGHQKDGVKNQEAQDKHIDQLNLWK